jgi:hypothetical protein
MTSQIVHSNHGTSFIGQAAVDIFRARVISRGIRFYIKTGIKPNRAYTPKAMCAAASAITGQQFNSRKRGELARAADALDTWLDEHKWDVEIVDA